MGADINTRWQPTPSATRRILTMPVRRLRFKPLLLLLAALGCGAPVAASPLTTGEAALERGDHVAAYRALTTALEQAHTPQQHARAALGLARWQLREGELDAAQDSLRQASRVAHGDPGMSAAIAETQGRLAILQGDSQAARAAFKQALVHARQADDPRLEAAIRLNQLRLHPASRRSGRELKAIARLLDTQPATPERWRLQLELARLASASAPALAQRQLDALLSEPALPTRLASQVLGERALLAERQGQAHEALRQADAALAMLSDSLSPDVRFELEWQRARVLQQLHRAADALSAYRHAITHLERIRADLPSIDLDGNTLFENTLAPLYRGYADLLLRQAAMASGRSARQLRRDAQEAIEAYRAVELQDYFKNACAVTRRRLATLESGTAVLYPIVLPDRLELLLGLGADIHQATLPISQSRLDAQVRAVTDSLRLDERLLPFDRAAAAQLYDWLLTPFDALLRAKHIDTLVFIPDGILRTLPLAALWDGEAFVIERQAVVTAPGLSLLDSGRAPGGRVRALLAGLSEPGPVVKDLPRWMVTAYAQSAPAASRGLPLIRGLNLHAQEALASRSPSNDPRALARLQEALALPGVAREIEQLAEVLTNTRLENETFRFDAVREELTRPYRIVHLASHGVFTGDPAQSFILTYDRLLNMHQLGEFLQSEAFDSTPVELLTLSACQTAEGDERSPLGLTGVAIQAGARSALGSLWPVSDAATQALLPAFYRALLQPGVSKAQALQQAQLQLLRGELELHPDAGELGPEATARLEKEMREIFRHPFFWSAFILIGNWQH